MKILFISILLIIFPAHLSAQILPTPPQSLYDQVQASKVVKKRRDFNLAGKVKSIVEISAQTNDSTFCYYFNSMGFLEKKLDCRSREFTEYTFENGRLIRTYFKQFMFRHSTERYFNSLGYLEKEIIEGGDLADTFHRVASYLYSKAFDTLNISYVYTTDISHMDIVLHDRYVLSFNNKKQLIAERNLSTHPETTYGSTWTYVYDSLTGNLTGMTCIDDCALTPSSNSCANYVMSIEYDDENRVILKSLSDFTVRNSTWSNSFRYSVSYNNKGDIIEESYSYGKNAFVFDVNKKMEVKSKDEAVRAVKPRYFYEYDSHGNWVGKYETLNEHPMLVMSRIIEYE